MIKSYFLIAWRNLKKNRFSSFINIGGLAVGLAVTLLIGLWIYDELSFNKEYKNYDRIAKVMKHSTNNGVVQTSSAVPYPLAEELRKNYSSDLKRVVLAGGNGSHMLAVGDKTLKKRGTYFEPQITELLTLKMIRGSRNGLEQQASILLSQSTAKAFFGDADPINQVMKLNNNVNVKVTGVYEDLQHSTIDDVEFMCPWDLYFATTEWIRTAENPWRPNAYRIFVQLADNANLATVSAKIKDVQLKHLNAQLAKKKPAMFLQPMSNWHLYAEFKNGINTGGRIKYVWLFGFIGAFVLLLACINFMNLSTARSEKRAKEVGIRKAIGSLRSQLIYQFFSESILVVFLSFLLSLALVQVLLPFFNEVADKQMTIPWSSPLYWLAGFAFSLITGLIAGSYPAFYFSSFRPVKILKGTFRVGRWAAIPRKVLVVIQFTVSVVMIIGTIVVFRQVQFVKNRPVGYNTSGLVSLPMITGEIHKHYTAVQGELMDSKVILSMAEAGNPTTQTWNSSSGFDWDGKDPNLSIDFPKIDVSYEYGKTINWEFAAGRDFSKDFASDSLAFIVNESAVKFMGLKNPVGATMRWFDEPYKIIGVVKDIVVNNPYDPVRPSVYVLNTGQQSIILLKLNPAVSAHTALTKIESVFKKFNPAQPFEYSFVDEDYALKFLNEERVGKLAGFFAVLAIFISCLGLFGMASFVAGQRIKEIGVRKVLGASVFSVWRLLSKDFVALVIISLFIATPIAWYLMHNWLQNYEFRTDISWWIFIVAGIGALVITLLTVSYQAIKAALANPVVALRGE